MYICHYIYVYIYIYIFIHTYTCICVCGRALQCCFGIKLRRFHVYMQRSHDRSAAVAGPLLISLTSLKWGHH